MLVRDTRHDPRKHPAATPEHNQLEQDKVLALSFNSQPTRKHEMLRLKDYVKAVDPLALVESLGLLGVTASDRPSVFSGPLALHIVLIVTSRQISAFLKFSNMFDQSSMV
jgi:hypothetical protein